MQAEEIVVVRDGLRNPYRLALETSGRRDYELLVEIYSSGCARLVRLLKREARDHERLDAYIHKQIKQASKVASAGLEL